MKRNYYLIDTENVGDRWFDLLQKIKKKDRIIVFYTEHHSKHLEKYLAKQVHNPRMVWLECTAGNNALDYQLIGVLSYLIVKHPKSSFYIYSNDRDYQTAIDFWQSRGIEAFQKDFSVESGKKAKKKKGKKKKGQKKKGAASVQTSAEAVMESACALEKPGQKKPTEEQFVVEIAKSIPVSDLGGWYHALTAVLGQENGRNWYLKVRDDAEWKERLSRYCMKDEYKRGVNLVAVVLGMHNLDVTRSEEAYRIIQSHNRKNLRAISADFDKRFGKKPPQKYFKVLRPLIRVIKGK